MSLFLAANQNWRKNRYVRERWEGGGKGKVASLLRLSVQLYTTGYERFKYIDFIYHFYSARNVVFVKVSA